MSPNSGKTKWVVRVGAPQLSHHYWIDNDPDSIVSRTQMWYGQKVSLDGVVSECAQTFPTKKSAQEHLEKMKKDEWNKYELTVEKYSPRKFKP